MAAKRTEKSKEKWWVLILCVLVSVLLLALCCRRCASSSETTTSETVTESIMAMSEGQAVVIEDISEKAAAAKETPGNQESLTESIDLGRESDAESQEESTEPEMTKKEAAQTLPEETTEEAVTTTEENVSQMGTVVHPKETTIAPSTQTLLQTTAAPTTKAAEHTSAAATAPTTVAHQHNYQGTVTKAATCGTTGVMTYTCSCGKSYTDTIPATGDHNWVEQTKIVHHDAVTHNVHHDAVTHIVHHDEVSHQEWVVDRPAYDELVTETHSICSGCEKDLTVMEWEMGTTPAEHSLWHLENDGIGYGWHTEQVVVSVIHHEEVGHYKIVVDQPAWDETVVDQPAWDETVVDKEAWEETVHDCYKCSACGAIKP